MIKGWNMTDRRNNKKQDCYSLAWECFMRSGSPFDYLRLRGIELLHENITNVNKIYPNERQVGDEEVYRPTDDGGRTL
ncbi:MAG: hypothetical protein IJX26_02310 [Clostridia bacterium]|nr:hypothetical protein [Clostridia bacterium]